ncbi:MAG: dimethylarginine dimethylaminohydrolase family protein [Gemmatimonadaceae bacterium]
MPSDPPSWIAFTREVSPTIAQCELTHLARAPIDVGRARTQHLAYEQLLGALGCTVRRVTAAPDHPDAVFIEDAAVVFDELAVITRPGAESRRAETVAVEAALQGLRPIVRIAAPGTLDGGDVLVVGRSVFVGRTGRTNDAGIAQLRLLLAPLGYAVEGIGVTGCLHLKSAVTAVDFDTVLLNPEWVNPADFAQFRAEAVDPREPMGANVLRIGDQLVYGAEYPHTQARLDRLGYAPRTIDASELAKAEGAVTCCSLIVRA